MVNFLFLYWLKIISLVASRLRKEQITMLKFTLHFILFLHRQVPDFTWTLSAHILQFFELTPGFIILLQFFIALTLSKFFGAIFCRTGCFLTILMLQTFQLTSHLMIILFQQLVNFMSKDKRSLLYIVNILTVDIVLIDALFEFCNVSHYLEAVFFKLVYEPFKIGCSESKLIEKV